MSYECPTCGTVVGCFGGHIFNPVQPTTPQPSAEALRELVQRWRQKAKHHEIKGDRADQPADTSEWHKGMDEGISDCADELESLLAGGVAHG